MKHVFPNSNCNGGASLIEAVIAVGVLAVAIPMVFGALAEAAKSGLAARAETRSIWMIPACMDEIHASRAGRPRYFTPTLPGQTFPPAGEVWALAFSPEGQPIAPMPRTLYEWGCRELGGKTVRYIASLDSSPATANPATAAMVQVHISLEYPANAPAAKRRKLDFHTRMP